MSMAEIPTWVCIAQHESSYNTAAVGRLNGDGSADHGLFQISDKYWCTHDEYGGKACSISCRKLLDNDISDDVQCIKRIHAEHTRISGDGFTAWTVYQHHCRQQTIDKISTCFDQQILKTEEHTPDHIASTYYDTVSDITAGTGKVYTKCELAQELHFHHKIPLTDIPTWICIAYYESNYNTAAIGRLNTDGSADHGLFQISDLYWCSHDSIGGKACNIACSKLLDNDLTDDIQCIKVIHEEHTRISGNGFTAWTVYQPHCRNQTVDKVASCFNNKDILISQNNTMITKVTTISANKPTKQKIYEKCELAQELYFKHKMSMIEIPTWVCIAQHESSYNTAAIGRLNGDGSADHGLFQISDKYWCSHEGHGGKACNIHCNKLIDIDLSDDIRCIKIIHEEHTRISGNGFTAWTVYKPHCRHMSLNYIMSCFDNHLVQKVLETNTTTSTHKPNIQLGTNGTSLTKYIAPNAFLQKLPNGNQGINQLNTRPIVHEWSETALQPKIANYYQNTTFLQEYIAEEKKTKATAATTTKKPTTPTAKAILSSTAPFSITPKTTKKTTTTIKTHITPIKQLTLPYKQTTTLPPTPQPRWKSTSNQTPTTKRSIITTRQPIAPVIHKPKTTTLRSSSLQPNWLITSTPEPVTKDSNTLIRRTSTTTKAVIRKPTTTTIRSILPRPITQSTTTQKPITKNSTTTIRRPITTTATTHPATSRSTKQSKSSQRPITNGKTTTTTRTIATTNVVIHKPTTITKVKANRTPNWSWNTLANMIKTTAATTTRPLTTTARTWVQDSGMYKWNKTENEKTLNISKSSINTTRRTTTSRPTRATSTTSTKSTAEKPTIPRVYSTTKPSTTMRLSTAFRSNVHKIDEPKVIINNSKIITTTIASKKPTTKTTTKHMVVNTKATHSSIYDAIKTTPRSITMSTIRYQNLRQDLAKYKEDPFSHPFFAKYNEHFNLAFGTRSTDKTKHHNSNT